METETNLKITLVLFGMLIGGWVAVATGFLFSTFLWGILLLVVGVVYVFLKFKRGNEETIGFGWVHMILLLIGIIINGFISTFLVGGL